jgi:hypothetical protein
VKTQLVGLTVRLLCLYLKGKRFIWQLCNSKEETSLYECNSEAAIVPNDLFYNSAICKKYKIGEEWHALKSTTMKAVFNICSYPFLFSLEVKNDLITGDFNLFMMTQVFLYTYFKAFF